MDITESQKVRIADWVKQGETIAFIQRRLREEMELSLTYMDVRFLVDDLNLVYSESEDDCEMEEEKTFNVGEDQASDIIEEPELVSSVQVNVDPVTPPGALVCGTVNFSDGKQLAWQLSATGQLGLVPGDDPDYRPTPEDLQEFQSQLQQVLQKHGY